jgi:TP901 family phage tail tape measure protein
MNNGLHTNVTYTLQDDITKRLAAIEAKLKHFDTALEKSDKKVSGFGKGASNFSKNFKLGDGGKKAIEALDAIPNLNTSIISSAAGLANPYVIAGTAIAGLGAFTLDAIAYNQQWDKTMAKVNVTAGLTQIQLKGVSDRIEDLAKNSTVEFQQVPDAFNQIISGVGDVDKSMDVLTYALKGAQAGFTDINTVAEAGVNIMNSVGKQASGAKEIYDTLFATLNKGKGEFKDIADYLPRILPYSNQLGINFKETAAAFALMTASGQTTEQSTMLLQNAFVNLADGKKRSKLEQFVKIFDDTGKMRAMKDVVGDMSKKLTGLADQSRINLLEKFGFDSQAASAFSILTQNAERLEEFIDYVAKSSSNGGALAKAVVDSDNAANNIDKIHNKWNSWKKDWGSANGWWTDFTAAGLSSMNTLEKSWDGFTTLMRDTKALLDRSVGWMKDNDDGGLYSNKQNEWWNNYKFGQTNEVKAANEKDRENRRASLLGRATAPNDIAAQFKSWNVEGMQDKFTTPYDAALAKFGKQNVEAMFKRFGQALPTAIVDKPKPAPTSNAYNQSEAEEKQDEKDAKAAARLAKAKGKHHRSGGASADNLHSLSGSQSNRSIIVNIKSLVEHLTIQTTNIANLSASAIRKHVEEAIVMSVRDAELALASQ